MIQSVEIRNWQSLRRADLTLGRFTVIVGASSSGKSALIRALRAVASNTTGASAITRGADAAAITVRTDESLVTLEYARGAWRYRLVRDGQEDTFTKLNRAVPHQITDALRITPVPPGGGSINFAGQFDRPYLLTEPGATVARELGQLTNVDTIYAAVREANRRRATAASALKTRREDRDRLVQDANQFAGLRDRLARCERAEVTAERATRLATQISRLRTAVDVLATAEAVLAQTGQPVPDLTDTALLSAQHRLARLRTLLHGLGTAQKAAAQAATEDSNARGAEATLHQQLHHTLVNAGTCPTCQQPVPA